MSSTTSTTLVDDGCEDLPLDGCRFAERALLRIKDAVDDTKDKVRWKWSRGDATDIAELGEPLTATTYVLCVYDSVADMPTLVTEVSVAPNGAWRDKRPAGWRYKDRTGAFDGVTTMKLKAGEDRKAAMQLKAQGLNVPHSML